MSLHQVKPSTFSLVEEEDEEDDIELPISVQAMLFLQSRKMTKDHGNVFLNKMDINIFLIPNLRLLSRTQI